MAWRTIRGFKIDRVRSSSTTLQDRIIEKSNGFGSEPGEPRFLSNPPLQRTGAQGNRRSIAGCRDARAAPALLATRGTIDRPTGAAPAADRQVVRRTDWMGTRDHYVSRFFLAGFTDLSGPANHEPWLWIGSIDTGLIVRRAPKNVGWSRNLFSAPGGLLDPSDRLERFLAEEVEGPAAPVLRKFVAAPLREQRDIPAELVRFLAWLAARSLAMRDLFEGWIDSLPTDGADLVEPPPPGWEKISPGRERFLTMEHPSGRVRTDVRSGEIEDLRGAGWRWRFSQDDFLEMVNVQALYFQARWFPRFSWKILDAPPGSVFVTGDRPAVWGVDGDWSVPPAALRDGHAEMVIPLSRSRALFASNPQRDRVGPIAPAAINRAIALGAGSWIAGCTEQSVRDALEVRGGPVN